MSLTYLGPETVRDTEFWPDVYFTPEYGRAEQERTGGQWLSLCSEDGRWQMPLVTRPLDGNRWDATTPYGYAGIYMANNLRATVAAELASEAVNLLAKEGCVSVFVRRSPLVRQGRLAATQVSVVADHPVRLITLGRADDMWSALTGRARTAIRKAERSGLWAHVRPLELNELANHASPFRQLYEATMRRVAASSHYDFSDSYYQALNRGLSQQLSVAEVLNREDTVVATALLMRHGGTQHYHLSGSDPDAARLGANNLLLWMAMTAGAENGVTRFLLGGGLSGEDSLYKFKQSFGGRQLSYTADGYVIDCDEYARRVRLAAPGGPRSSTFFPAYRTT